MAILRHAHFPGAFIARARIREEPFQEIIEVCGFWETIAQGNRLFTQEFWSAQHQLRSPGTRRNRGIVAQPFSNGWAGATPGQPGHGGVYESSVVAWSWRLG